jgi:alpha-D-ribose 1-methylphosphonate 5-triphosphate synthase subunit PhnH
MKTVDIEKINRDNFRLIMNVLSMPGTVEKIEPLFKSTFLALANTLLYSEVSYFYDGNEEFTLIDAITNAKKEDETQADYLFCDEINEFVFNKAKLGTPKDPEFSGTLIFKCKDFKGLNTRLSGPGIDGFKDITLPVDNSFIKFFNEKNSSFPLGNEVFFLSEKGKIMALCRTTKVEVI